jgi:vacuolar protein sorting-associated protein 53
MNGIKNEPDNSSLYSPYYDPLKTLNQIFPDPFSLGSLSAVQLDLTAYSRQLDMEIETTKPLQHQLQAENQQRIKQLQEELEDLFKNVEVVRGKAENADRVMGGLTKEILRLDGGKKNLTTSMTVLKRLQMLSTFQDLIQVILTPSNCIRTITSIQQSSPIQRDCSTVTSINLIDSIQLIY